MMKKHNLVKACLIITLVSYGVACKKSKDDGPNTIDEAKLTNKEWRDSKTGTPWTILKFNADKTGYYKSITNLITETYQTFNYTWATKGGDSLKLDIANHGQYTLKVYSVNDTILVTNNWTFGDTARVQLYSN